MARRLAHEVREPGFSFRPVPVVASADGLLRDNSGRWSVNSFMVVMNRFGWRFHEKSPKIIIPLPGVAVSSVGLDLLGALYELSKLCDIHVRLTWKVSNMPDVVVDVNPEKAEIKTLTVALVASEYRGRTERAWWRSLVEEELSLRLDSGQYIPDLREMFRQGLVQYARGPEFVILAWGEPENIMTKCFRSIVPGHE